LLRVAKVWPILPAPIRSALMTIVETAVSSRGKSSPESLSSPRPESPPPNGRPDDSLSPRLEQAPNLADHS
jgi:hypothetical protein